MKSNTSPSEMGMALDPLRPVLFKAAIFSMVISMLMLAPTLYMLEVYDRVINSRNSVTLGMLTLMIVLAYALMEILEKIRASMMRAAGVRLDRALSKRVYDAMFQGFLSKQMSGTLQPLSDLRTIREFLSNPALMAVLEAPVALFAITISFLISPVLGTATLFGASVQVFVAVMNERATRKTLMEANQSAGTANQFADSAFRNSHVIQSMGMLNDLHEKWQKRQRKFLALQSKASDGAGLWTNMSKAVQLILGSFLLGIGAWLQMNNALNGGPAMMIIGSVVGGRVLAPLTQLVSQWNGVVNVRESWARLEGLLNLVPSKQESMPLPEPKGNLSVQGVVATAPGQKVAIIQGVRFELKPGEVLAVVGPSASGKSTLARLLVGSWPTQSGKVRLDGVDVQTWDKSELGPYLGYLPQGIELLDGTIAENIARFGEVDMDQVESAAKLVGLHELIMSLPQAYNSPVGRDGTVLSGGQRQRVGLARALYGEPVLVVLDEPNSSLDDAGDLALANAIALMKQKGSTFVIMTHLSHVLRIADKMLVMRDGAQQAFGPIDEVTAALQQAREKIPK
jgi:ATP-binding cassette, subfamily C, bacterial exporter for protease/lipase